MATTTLSALRRMLRRAQKQRARLALMAALALPAMGAEGNSITLHVGPASVGTGGSNPISIPPVNPLEYELVYVSKEKWETSVAISPGLLFGKRSEVANGPYVGFGGGLVQSYNGGGPGVYSCLGIDIGKTWTVNAEVKQAVGFDFSRNQMISPYAIRLGMSYMW